MTHEQPRRWRRILLLLVCNPATSLVLLVLLSADIAWHGMGVREALQYYFPVGRYREMFIVGDERRIVEGQRESIDYANEYLLDSHDSVVFAAVQRVRVHSGVWAPTRVVDGATVVLEPFGGVVLSDEDEAEVRQAIAEHLRADPLWGDDADYVLTDAATERVLINGYINNVLTLVGLALFVASLYWIVLARKWRRRRRMRELLKRGLCPRCRYNIGDTAGCPECGLSRADMDRAAGWNTPHADANNQA